MAKEWSVEPSGTAGTGNMGIAVAAIDSSGRAGFAESMLGAINASAAFEHCTVFRFTRDAGQGIGCTILDAASRYHTPVARHTSRIFVQSFAQYDWNTRYLDPAPANLVRASYFSTRDILHHEYRASCYDRNGLIDRLSFAINDGCDAVVTFNLYRSIRRGLIGSHECASLIRMAPVIAHASLRHAKASKKKGAERGIDLVGRLPNADTLTPREIYLCTLLLEGFSIREAAEKMGVQASTATTLKKRAFARLNLKTKEDMLRRLIG